MSDFDPDAYLAQKAGAQVFDPDAYLAQKTDARPQYSAADSALGGFTQGATLGFGDEMMGGIDAGLNKVLPESMGGAPAGTDFVEDYKKQRDEYRKLDKNLQADNSKSYTGGNLVGALMGSFALPEVKAAQGAGWARRAALAGTQGGILGGLSAVGNSEAEAGSDQAKDDSEKGALAGGLTGAGLSAAGSALGPLGRALTRIALNTGRRVLTNTGSALSSRAPLADKAVEEAFRQGAFPPLGTTEGASNTLSATRERVGQQLGDTVKELETAGVSGPNAAQLAQQFDAEARQIRGSTLGSPRPAVFSGIARELLNKPLDAAGNLGLSQAEAMKRELQHLARNEFDKLNSLQTPKGEAQEAVASRMRQAVEDSVDAQKSLAPDAAARFVPLKDQFGNIAAADNAAFAGANRAKKNNAVSLKDLLLGGAGGPVGIAVAHVARTRGPSTLAWASHPLGRALSGLAPNGTPSSTGQFLLKALAGRLSPALSEEAGQGVSQ